MIPGTHRPDTRNRPGRHNRDWYWCPSPTCNRRTEHHFVQAQEFDEVEYLHVNPSPPPDAPPPEPVPVTKDKRLVLSIWYCSRCKVRDYKLEDYVKGEMTK